MIIVISLYHKVYKSFYSRPQAQTNLGERTKLMETVNYSI